ncbi:cytochrome P450 monooxygenase [Mariannaea sp. PMI_226]|nr:cytochrome P450 monooxygenase [Mariannaea sp. PMI_226]
MESIKSLPDIHILTFIAGVVSYVAYFFHGEHHMYGLVYIQLHAIVFATSTFLLYRLGSSLLDASLQTLVYDGCFMAGLFGSLFVYRAFFNPLNAIPGPFIARIATFWISFRIKRLRMFAAFEELHNKYGYFVRVGSKEVSITHPKAIVDIFGANSVCQKGPWYDISKPQDSVLLRRTFAKHAERRAIWTRAFSVKAVRGYEVRFHPYRTKMFSKLDEFAGQPVNITHWLGLFSWDTMSDLSFGHPFGLLDSKEHHWAMGVLDEGMGIIGRHLPMWFVRLGSSVPGGNRDLKNMYKYCHEQMLLRYNTEPKVPDVIGGLFEPYKKGVLPWDDTAHQLMAGEAHLLVNAGSDTSRITMIATLFTLAQRPELVNRLRKELEPHVPKDTDEMLMDSSIMNIDLLNGIVQEALRLYPPSPSHPTRVTPPEGTVIAGRFIPGNTQVIAPQYVIGRDERIFPRANEFIPERWYSLPELITDKSAIAPFSLGPMNCVGKGLALSNIRVTVALMVMRYNLSSPSTQADPQSIFENGLYEHFALQSGPVLLCLEKRQK